MSKKSKRSGRTSTDASQHPSRPSDPEMDDILAEAAEILGGSPSDKSQSERSSKKQEQAQGERKRPNKQASPTEAPGQPPAPAPSTVSAQPPTPAPPAEDSSGEPQSTEPFQSQPSEDQQSQSTIPKNASEDLPTQVSDAQNETEQTITPTATISEPTDVTTENDAAAATGQQAENAAQQPENAASPVVENSAADNSVSEHNSDSAATIPEPAVSEATQTTQTEPSDEAPVQETRQSAGKEAVGEQATGEETSGDHVARAAAERPVAQQPSRPQSDELLFRDLPLSEEVQLAVQMSGYIAPTPVQAEIIPHVLSGRDVLAQSQTGSGKTAAFALPILSTLDFDGGRPSVLVLAPTRELATQVAASFGQYGACMPKLRVTAIYGGADYEPQLRSLKKGAHVVVGTPGRVIDHIKRGSLKLDAIKCLVLDEADEMLNMGFHEDVEFVLAQTPETRQVALFSATMPPPIRRIADRYLKDPTEVRIKQQTLTADSINQRAVFVEERNKPELLSRMLEVEDTDGVIVFTKTRESTLNVAERLGRGGVRAAALNGDLPQTQRQRAVDQLKSGKLDVLVATDVAARGLDVERISHVFNYDLPHDSESYVHRIGRTGRAGRTGEAVIFLTPRQRRKLRVIEKATRKQITIAEPPSADQVNAHRIAHFKQRIAEQAKRAKKMEVFRGLVGECIADTGMTAEDVAAALAAIAQGGKPLFVEELPTVSMRSAHERGKGGRNTDGRGRDGRSRDSRGRERGGRRRFDESMQSYRVEVGSTDGVKPGNIVGAIANEAGLSGSDIGSIKILEHFSFVDLPANVDKEVINRLQKTWVAGKQLGIRAADNRGGHRASPGTRGKPYGKSHSGKPHSGKPSTGGKKRSFVKGKAKPDKWKSDGVKPAAAKGKFKKSRPVGGKPKKKR